VALGDEGRSLPVQGRIESGTAARPSMQSQLTASRAASIFATFAAVVVVAPAGALS